MSQGHHGKLSAQLLQLRANTSIVPSHKMRIDVFLVGAAIRTNADSLSITDQRRVWTVAPKP